MKRCKDCKWKAVHYISGLGFGSMRSKCRILPSKNCSHYKRKWWKFCRIGK